MLKPRQPNTFPTELGLRRRRASAALDMCLLPILLSALVIAEGTDLLGRARDALKRRFG